MPYITATQTGSKLPHETSLEQKPGKQILLHLGTPAREPQQTLTFFFPVLPRTAEGVQNQPPNLHCRGNVTADRCNVISVNRNRRIRKEAVSWQSFSYWICWWFTHSCSLRAFSTPCLFMTTVKWSVSPQTIQPCSSV